MKFRNYDNRYKNKLTCYENRVPKRWSCGWLKRNNRDQKLLNKSIFFLASISKLLLSSNLIFHLFLCHRNEELKSRLKNEELIREKNRLERDVIETTTNELKQRVSSLNAVKCRLEREMLENRNHMQEAIDSLKLENISHQRRSNELQLQLDTQSKTIKDLEEAVLGFGDGKVCSLNLCLHYNSCTMCGKVTRRPAGQL